MVLTVAGLTVAGKAHQEMVPDWNGVQIFGAPHIESANSEGDDFSASDPSLEVGYEVLSDPDTPEWIHCFFEGRRLLLEV